MRITQIDAFTDRAFAGNPAAVVLVEAYPEAREMLALAREMNLSETAFLRPIEGDFELRWFTPEIEVDLCGHATLASAHYLWSEGLVDRRRELDFHTRSGTLRAAWDDPWIEMDFPSQPVSELEPADGLLEALDVEPRFVGRNDVDWLVEVHSERQVRDLQPDMGGLRRANARGVIVTSVSESAHHDFISRFFAPAVGVDEDPVTGSAHCSLGPYWAQRLGKGELVGYQASERGGVVRVSPRGDRTLLAGRAVTVLQCRLEVAWPRLS